MRSVPRMRRRSMSASRCMSATRPRRRASPPQRRRHSRAPSRRCRACGCAGSCACRRRAATLRRSAVIFTCSVTSSTTCAGTVSTWTLCRWACRATSRRLSRKGRPWCGWGAHCSASVRVSGEPPCPRAQCDNLLPIATLPIVRVTTYMKNVDIAFIGGGNMARSLIGGLLADGVTPERIWVADPNEAALHTHQTHFGVHTATDNRHAAAQADVVVLAVKPQVAKDAAQDLSPVIRQRPALVISVAAGIREGALRAWLGKNCAIVRAMPNTTSLVRSGATALFANPHVTSEQKNLAESILRAVVMTLWVEDESLMDAVTALSGSGPA